MLENDTPRKVEGHWKRTQYRWCSKVRNDAWRAQNGPVTPFLPVFLILSCGDIKYISETDIVPASPTGVLCELRELCLWLLPAWKIVAVTCVCVIN